MNYNKIFFPICGGDELEERLYGVFLVTKYFNSNLEILKCGFKTNRDMDKRLSLPKEILYNVSKVIDINYNDENRRFKSIIKKVAKEVNIRFSPKFIKNEACVTVKTKEGLRSTLVENESKYCDLVVVTAPLKGIATKTFEAAVLKSGKPVLVIPRVMKQFRLDSIIIAWNNSSESSRAITSSIEILKHAKRVHIVSSQEYLYDNNSLKKVVDHLKNHNITASFEVISTTNIPGYDLVNTSLFGNFNLIVAGAYRYNGLKERIFSGSTRYLLENTSVPVLMPH